MSRKERSQMTVMAGVQRQELTQGQAAELLGGDRQVHSFPPPAQTGETTNQQQPTKGDILS